MKLQNTLALGFSFALLLTTQASAAETVSNPINEDLFFSNGVQLQDVSESAEGVAAVTLQGSGSLTVGSQSNGGFPRVTVLSGSTITSTRNWPAETVPKTSWDGQLTAPGSGRLPSPDEIVFTHSTNKGYQVSAVKAFVWGLANETFSFSTAARFVFPVEEVDGQRLWVASGDGSSWTVGSEDDYCVVESGLCYLEMTSFAQMALVKNVYDSCPRASVTNGNVGSAPNCVVTCEAGYEIDNEGNECLADSFSSSASSGGGEETVATEEVETVAPSEAALSIADLTEEQQAELFAFAQEQEVDPLAILAQVPGNIKLRESSIAWQRYLPEYDDLTAEELAQVRHLNTGYLSRNPRSAAEQLANRARGEEDPAVARQKQDSFINYLLQTRNNIAARDQIEIRAGEVAGEGVTTEAGGEEVAEGAAEGFHSAGGQLLPSTGPGLFMTIAIIGFMLMLFGGIRRN